MTGPLRAAVAVAAAGLVLLAVPASASAADGTSGQQLSVTPTAALDPTGQDVTVTGHGYDVGKGIYVAFCVRPRPGQLPTPCGGGADTSGSTGSSVWISSNPPSYGKGLAVPYGPGGSFRVTLHVAAQLDADHDCRKVECAVVTRNDHTRTDDRSQDVIVPVTFAAPGSSGSSPLLWGGIPIAVVVLGAGGLLLARRRMHR